MAGIYFSQRSDCMYYIFARDLAAAAVHIIGVSIIARCSQGES